VYKQAPDYMREGGSIPVTLTFAEALGVNVLLLPMGRGDDGAQYVSSLPQKSLLSRLDVLETVRRMKS
jgi:Cys-Gly metallodipeptidase DUG1